MKTNHVKFLVIVVFALTLGAGVVAGLLASRLPATLAQPGGTSSSGGSLAAELSLTSDQREKMKEIWVGVQKLSIESLELARKAQGDRDRSVEALIPADKIDLYNKIQRDYAEAAAKLEGRRQAAFEKAVKQTNEMLDPIQRVKYEKILKNRLQSESGGGTDDRLSPPNQRNPDSLLK